jgi:hypothetical protein
MYRCAQSQWGLTCRIESSNLHGDPKECMTSRDVIQKLALSITPSRLRSTKLVSDKLSHGFWRRVRFLAES